MHLGYKSYKGQLSSSTGLSSRPRPARDLENPLRKSIRYFSHLWKEFKCFYRFEILVKRAFIWCTLTHDCLQIGDARRSNAVMFGSLKGDAANSPTARLISRLSKSFMPRDCCSRSRKRNTRSKRRIQVLISPLLIIGAILK